ncbi:DUF4396 domain-containing protein [Priestia koreensis]|uniref:DUF4396 domain-containing protein n=1 Tax=Priestia koreensis TaxID=284581 RepID=UPI00203D7A52|nr:DUF4396 domain-containing protein [Priestia koreensis]
MEKFMLTTIAFISIFIGVMQAVIITGSIIKHPQEMAIMNVVWPITGLYFPVIGLWMYYVIGIKDQRDTSHQSDAHGHHQSDDHRGSDIDHSEHHHMQHSDKPQWQSVLVSTTHCSAGCSVGDLLGVPIVVLLGWTIAGSTLFSEYVVEFILAYLLGIGFQYYGMGMNKSGKSITQAIKADTWSLLAFEVGMFGWMALTHYVFFNHPPEATTPLFWFMMQMAMMIGFATSYPANWVLVKRGVKHAM